MGKHQSPNNKELILIALTEGGRMKFKEIREWLPANDYRDLRTPQVSGALDALYKERRIVRDGPKKGYYYSVAARAAADLADLQSHGPLADLSEGAVADDNVALIPCYGMNWHRDQVEWDERPPELLGSQGRDGESNTSVNFAEQFGVYVLYEWPNVTYVGRTTEGRLFERLHSHTTDNRRGWWDRFSWFGLLSVGANQRLQDRLDMKEAITAMEAILIEILSPPFNNKRGDRLGPRYSQVAVVEERNRKQVADGISRALARK